MRLRSLGSYLLLLAAGTFLSGCPGSNNSPASPDTAPPAPTATPTASPTPTGPTATFTSSPTNSLTTTPTRTATTTATFSPTFTTTPLPTSTPTASPTSTSTKTPSATPTNSRTFTPTGSYTATFTVTRTPTDIPTETPVCTTTYQAGYSAVGGNSGAFSNVFASKVTITESSSVTVTSLSCNFSGISGPIRAAIYSDSAAAPSTLIVESNVINLEGHFDWTQLDIPDTVLAPGTYWLALQTLQGSSLTFTLYDTGAGNIMAQS